MSDFIYGIGCFLLGIYITIMFIDIEKKQKESCEYFENIDLQKN